MSIPTDQPTPLQAALRAHPEVLEVAEALAPGPEPRTRVAAVVTRDWCSPVDLRDLVWEALGDGHPDVLAVLPALPRDDDGELAAEQVARAALDSPGAVTFRAPSTPTELVVTDVWRSVLGRERIGADDNFLDLGGDSMAGMLLLEQGNERLGVELTFDELLASPSLSALAAHVDAAARIEAGQ